MLSRVMSGCVGLILGMVILGSCTGDAAALSLVDSEGKPCQPLVGFFEALHTQAPEIFEGKAPATLADMNGWAQNNLLRTAQGFGVMKEKCQPILSQLTVSFENLGMVGERKPSAQKYDAILVLGATYGVMKNSRLQFLLQEVEGKKIEGPVYVLTGDRPLYTTSAHGPTELAQVQEALAQNPAYQEKVTNETEAAAFIIADLPEKLRARTTLLSCEMQPDGRRPNTEDTIRKFITEISPTPGSILLVITDNPFIGRQHQNVLKVLREAHRSDLKIETVGYDLADIPPYANLREDERFAQRADTLARWIHATVESPQS